MEEIDVGEVTVSRWESKVERFVADSRRRRDLSGDRVIGRVAAEGGERHESQ